MTQLHFARLNNGMTITNGQTDSSALSILESLYDAEAISVGAPVGLEANIYTWLGSSDKGVTYFTLVDLTGTAIIVPSAGKMIIYNGIFAGLTHLKIHSSVAVGADRNFEIAKSYRS